MSSIIFQAQSVLIVSLMIYGLMNRKIKTKHTKIMKTAILWDLLLVAQIELSRSAIDKASKVFSNPVLLNIHVTLAISTVLLYGLIFFTGRKLELGDESVRKFHKKVGITTFTIRILTLITSNLI